jgi:hypothetical protein
MDIEQELARPSGLVPRHRAVRARTAGRQRGTQSTTHGPCPDFDQIGSICAHCSEPDDVHSEEPESTKRPVVLDSEVLLGLADPSDAAHKLATAAAPAYRAAGHPLIVPATAYTQALTSRLCSTPLGLMRLRTTVARLVHQVQALDMAAADVAAKYQIRHPRLPIATAYTLAVAEVLNAECILTTEERWAHVSDLMRVLYYSYTIPPATDTFTESDQPADPEDTPR